MEGEVRCSDGSVGGTMKATMVASKTLLIGKSAVVTGDMVYDSLQVMDGGRLQGKLTHFSQAPQNQQQGSTKPEDKPAVEASAVVAEEGKPDQKGKPAKDSKPVKEAQKAGA